MHPTTISSSTSQTPAPSQKYTRSKSFGIRAITPAASLIFFDDFPSSIAIFRAGAVYGRWICSGPSSRIGFKASAARFRYGKFPQTARNSSILAAGRIRCRANIPQSVSEFPVSRSLPKTGKRVLWQNRRLSETDLWPTVQLDTRAPAKPAKGSKKSAANNEQRERVFEVFRRWGYLEATLDPLGVFQPLKHRRSGIDWRGCRGSSPHLLRERRRGIHALA